MSEVSQVFQKDAVETIGNVLGTGGGDRTGVASNSTDSGVGATFLTEPLWGQFVELLTEQSFVRQVAKSIPMDQPTLRVPAISTGLSVYTASEGAEAKSTSMKADDFLLQAKKIMAQVIASAELYEDSVQNIEKIITDDFVRAIAQAEEQAFLLGRDTQVGAVAKGGTKSGATSSSADTSIQGLTNFVNPVGGANSGHKDSAYTDEGSTFSFDDWGTVSDYQSGLGGQGILNSPLSICDGVLTTALQEGNVIDMKGSSFYGGNAYKAIREAIYHLGLLGRNRGDLVLILNPVSANQLLQSDELMTLDKYGANATILTGEVGSLFGVKILESSFMPSNGITINTGANAGTDDDNKGVDGYGKGAYGVLVHKPSLILGDLRKVQVENERVIQNDAFRTVISERIAFGMERRAGAVAIGNADSQIETLTSASVFYPAGVTPTLLVDDTNIEITTDGATGIASFTVETVGDTLVYLGNSGVPADVTIELDPGTGSYGSALANNTAVASLVSDTSVNMKARFTGVATNGTGTTTWQSVDVSGNRSDIITVTVSLSNQS